MLCLWEAEGPVPRSYFDARLRDSRGWADSTVLSLLSRLEEKGFLEVEKRGNRNIYSPLVSRQAYLDLENRSFLPACTTTPSATWWRGWPQARR